MKKVRRNNRGLMIEYGYEERDGCIFVEVTPLNCQARIFVLVDGIEAAAGDWVAPPRTSTASARIGKGQAYSFHWEYKR